MQTNGTKPLLESEMKELPPMGKKKGLPLRVTSSLVLMKINERMNLKLLTLMKKARMQVHRKIRSS